MAASFCGSCGAPAAPGGSFCPRCGASYAAPFAPTPAQTAVTAPMQTAAVAPTPVPTNVVPGKARVTQGMAIAALLLNILVWPGLGSLVAGRQVGWAQGFLQLGGIILLFTIILFFIAIPMMLAAWIWGLVTGIQLLQESSAPA